MPPVGQDLGNALKMDDIIIPGFRDIWGFNLSQYQVHARLILLDTVTGYRSQYQQGAFLIRAIS